MKDKKELKVEEIKQQYENAKKVAEELEMQLKLAQQEEENRKKAELELQKEERVKEIDAAQKHLNELYKAYIEDYGYLKIETKADDYDWFPSFWRRNFWF